MVEFRDGCHVRREHDFIASVPSDLASGAPARRGIRIPRVYPTITEPVALVVLITAGALVFGFPGRCMGQLAQRTRIEVAPSKFPASNDCRLAPWRSHLCPNPRYATFTMTITIGRDVQWKLPAEVRLSFAYKYKGIYRTQHRYTKYFSWAAAQYTSPTAANYVTAKFIRTPAAVTLHNEVDTGKPILELESTDMSTTLPAGTVIRVTFGDTTGGGPGYILPPVAYSIDLVVERRSWASGEFEVIDAAMPTLRIVGTSPDTLAVTAPSVMRAGVGTVTVRALQGDDGLTTNMYGVPGYAGIVEFVSTDPQALLPGASTFTVPDSGVRSFDVTLSSPGVHTVMVHDRGSGLTGESNPIVVPAAVVVAKAPVDVEGPASTAALGSLLEIARGWNLYWGNLHQHVNIGGHGAQTPEHAYRYGRDVSQLDFLALSDHCDPNAYDWGYAKELADRFYEPGRFVTFAAFEWSSREYGHRHVVFLDPSNDECYCSRNYGNPSTVERATLDELFAGYAGSDALLILHHAGWRYDPLVRTPETDDVVLGDRGYANQCLFEVYSHHGSSELHDNPPYTIHGSEKHQWGADKPVFFQDALKLGYRFGVTADGDNHTGEPSGHIAFAESLGYDYKYSRLGITAVYASEATRDTIFAALRAKRTYGTTGARMIVSFSVSGAVMGEEITLDEAPHIAVGVVGTATVQRISVFRNGTKLVYQSEPCSQIATGDFIDRDVAGGQTYSYYARIEQSDDHMAWTSPVWVNTKDHFASERPPPFAITSIGPNPFNSETVIRVSQPGRMPVSIDIWSVDGRRVRILRNERELPEGSTDVIWNGRNASGEPVASGVYFVRFRNSLGARVAKATVIR